MTCWRCIKDDRCICFCRNPHKMKILEISETHEWNRLVSEVQQMTLLHKCIWRIRNFWKFFSSRKLIMYSVIFLKHNSEFLRIPLLWFFVVAEKHRTKKFGKVLWNFTHQHQWELPSLSNATKLPKVMKTRLCCFFVDVVFEMKNIPIWTK